MREIKHRLILRNKIVGYEKWYSGSFSEDMGWNAHPLWLYSKDNGNSWSPNSIFHTDKNLFTGFKDKFGKEIYEGDILEITNQTSELKGSKVSVVFKEGCFCDGYYGWRLSQHKEYNLEIIGNIYENPELLTPPLS